MSSRAEMVEKVLDLTPMFTRDDLEAMSDDVLEEVTTNIVTAAEDTRRYGRFGALWSQPVSLTHVNVPDTGSDEG